MPFAIKLREYSISKPANDLIGSALSSDILFANFLRGSICCGNGEEVLRCLDMVSYGEVVDQF